MSQVYVIHYASCDNRVEYFDSVWTTYDAALNDVICATLANIDEYKQQVDEQHHTETHNSENETVVRLICNDNNEIIEWWRIQKVNLNK